MAWEKNMEDFGVWQVYQVNLCISKKFLHRFYILSEHISPSSRGVHLDPDLIQPTRPNWNWPTPINLWALAISGGLQIPKAESGGSVGRFSPLKPASTDLIEDFKNLAIVFGQITSDPMRFMPDLGRSQPNLVEISPDLARSHQMWWDLRRI